MNRQFKHHYTREEAQALLPELRVWLGEIQELQSELARYEIRLDSILSQGDDAGGDSVNKNVRAAALLHQLTRKLNDREIFIKDAERGLVDFPAIIGGREVFLCWELDEDEVEFWHDIDTGFSDRERLSS